MAVGPTDRTQPPGDQRQPGIFARFREDGSLDFTGPFVVGMYGDVSGLRRAGDHVISPVDPTKELEVVWSRYTPKSSMIVVQVSDEVDGTRKTTLAFYSALMRDDTTVSYWVGGLPTENDPELSVTEYHLRRASQEEIAKEHALHGVSEAEPAQREYPRPTAAYKKMVVTASGPTGAKIDFCLVTPGKPDGPLPIVVCLHLTEPSCEWDSLVKQWGPCAAELQCAVLLPGLDTVPWLIGEPDRSEAEAVADQVLACIEKAQELVPTDGVFLLSESVGGNVGHMIWQRDNRAFRAYMAWDSAFREWVTDPPAEVDKGKPIFIWSKLDGFKRVRERSVAAANWYSQHGFRVVKFAERDIGMDDCVLMAGLLAPTEAQGK
jgi:hypothetical protein